MASTYSTNLALELIGTGDQAGTWGTTTNTNLGTLIEQAVSGYVTQAITDGADTVITIPNGATGVARNMVIECTGTLTAARNLVVPANKKLYFIYNNTAGGYAVTVKVSGQTGVSVPNGAKLLLASNGTDVVNATTYTYTGGPGAFSTLSASSDFAIATNKFTVAAASGNTVVAGTLAVTLASSKTAFSVGGGTGTSYGWYLGNLSSNTAGMWTTGVAPDSTNYRLWADSSYTFINGSTYSGLAVNNALVATASSSGLAVTGAVTASNPSGGLAYDSNATGQSNQNMLRLANSGGRLYCGVEASAAGTIITGDTAYDAVIVGAAGIAFSASNGSAMQMRLSSSGLAVTGTQTIGGTGIAANTYYRRGTDGALATYIGYNSAGSSNAFDLRNESTGGYFRFCVNGDTTNAAMTLDSSGNLGLGATPSAWGGGFTGAQVTAGASLASNGTNSMVLGQNWYYNGSNDKYVGSYAASAYQQTGGAHKWFTAPSGTAGNTITFTQAMTLDSSGVFTVGGAAATYHQFYQNATSDWTLYGRAEKATPYGICVYYTTAPNGNGSNAFQFQDSGGVRFTVKSNGGIDNYQSNDSNLSDRREKTNFAPAKSYLDVICAIPVQTFNYIDQNLKDDPGLTLGVVAQDVHEVAPELVHESNWGTKDDPKMRLSIYQTDMQYALMKCIQELSAKNDALEARLAALEAA